MKPFICRRTSSGQEEENERALDRLWENVRLIVPTLSLDWLAAIVTVNGSERDANRTFGPPTLSTETHTR